jgi:LSD1 subclass zinc finger protein
MTDVQWARVRDGQNLKIRRGAWYRITRLLPDEVVLDVNRQAVAVPRALVEIAPTRPLRWTIVPCPRDAVRVPPQWGTAYAVCPSCRNRAQVLSGTTAMRCARCHGLFSLAQGEPQLARAMTGGPPAFVPHTEERRRRR